MKLAMPMDWITERLPPLMSAEPARSELLFDRSLVLMVISLFTLGLIAVASASIPEGIAVHHDPYSFVKRHAVYVLFSLICMAALVQCPVDWWQRYNGQLLGAAIVLLIAVLVVGRNVNGSTRWIGFGPLNLQPAEFAKLALFAYLSGYLVRRSEEVRENLKGFIKPLLVFLLLAILLLNQPDFGTVVVMLVTTVGMLFIGGAKLIQFFCLIIAGVLAVVSLIVLEPYRVRRVTSFLDPWEDPFGSGYQLTQSLMAFGRGSWLGEGLGNSVLKLEYLPEAHTDFVMAILGEELGFVGVTLVVFLLACLALKAMNIGRRALQDDQAFEGYLACGIGIWIAFQSAVNIGAASGMLPTKGLTLPLVSYGGSSLLVMSIAVALLLRIDYEWRIHQLQALSRGDND
jgi:cell division protein FtsW